MEAGLVTRLEEGATLLTATQRLSRHLRAAFDAAQAAQGREVWATADILPYSAWLRRAWETAVEEALLADGGGGDPPPLLLSSAQAQVLWEDVIARDARGRALLEPASAARHAAQARELLLGWKLEQTGAGLAGTEARVFAGWHEAFRARCRDEGWMDGAELPTLMTQWLAEGRAAAPPAVLLAGFDEWTPQQEALWAAVRGAGGSVEGLPAPRLPATTARVACQDEGAEIEAAARWARHHLEQGAAAPIAVIVPDLARTRAAIRRVFTEVLAPTTLLPGAPDDLPFNLSHGEPLSALPLPAAALEFLDLGGEAMPVEQATRLLLSPFLQGAEEAWHARALLDASLRREGRMELPLAAVARAAGRPTHGMRANPGHAPMLAACLERWRAIFEEVRGQRLSAAAWAPEFDRLWRALGWPSHLRLDSAEHQTLNKLMEVVSDFAALGLVAGPVTFGEAVARLRRLAGEVTFQPEGGDAPVQVLGVLEAGGLSFERAWVMGLHDEAWPPRPRPNPFLPAAWQRAHDLPHSSAGREMAYAQRVTARLLACAGEIVVSHPVEDTDHEIRASRLIADVAPGDIARSDVPIPAEVLRASGPWVSLPDHLAPPLPAGDVARGGATLFKDQAACPFRAFAAHRLHARALEQPGFGLDAAARGSLVHKVMDNVWGLIGESTRLAAIAPADVEGAIAPAVNAALEEYGKEHPGALAPPIVPLEARRLTQLAGEFLQAERERAPFTVVEREQEVPVEIGGLQVNTRVDRIDQLADQRYVMLDYKTGRDAKWSQWQGPRPDEPQLPLYCSSANVPIAAVAFATLRRGASGFNGLAAEEGLLPKAKLFSEAAPDADDARPPDEAVVAAWRATLEALAAQFRDGHAAVLPKKPGATCKYCDLPPLCRIHESGARWDDEEEEDDG